MGVKGSKKIVLYIGLINRFDSLVCVIIWSQEKSTSRGTKVWPEFTDYDTIVSDL